MVISPGRLVRLLISGLLMAGLLWHVDFSAMWMQMHHAAVMPFLLALGLSVAQVFAVSARWRMMLASVRLRLPFHIVVETIVAGIIANTLLINVLGGLAARVLLLVSQNVPVRGVLSTLVLERAMVLAVLVALTVLGLPWLGITLAVDDFPATSLAAVATGLACLSILVAARSRLAASFRRRAGDFIRAMAADLRDIVADRPVLMSSIMLTVLSQVLLIAVGLVIAVALDIDIAMVHLLAILPLVALVSSLPISVGGWGVRELSLVYALAQFGVSLEQAMLLSVLIGVSTLAAALLTGVGCVTSRKLRLAYA